MAILGSFTKQPADVFDYDIDFSEWLTDGDGIASATATTDGTGLTVQSVFYGQKSVKVWLSGGVAGNRHKVTVTATTDDGRVVQHEFKVAIKEY